MYLSFGAEIDRALATPAAGRGQAVLFQFLRGLPAEVLDRAVLRLRDPSGLTLDEIAARADAAGLPIEIPRAELGEGPMDPARLIGFTADFRLTTVAEAEILWVAPLRHWTTDAYRGADPAVLTAALSTPYPLARLIFDGVNGVSLGLPAPLVTHAHGETMAGLRRPLDARDLPAGPGRRIGGYGDLLTALAEPGTRAFVQVDGEVFLALHDRHGLSLLDPATGGAAVLPPTPDRIALHPVDGAPDLAAWLHDLRTRRPGTRPIRHSAGIRAIPLGDAGRTLDVIGTLHGRLLTEITAAASATGVHAPVVVVATGRPTDAQLSDLE